MAMLYSTYGQKQNGYYLKKILVKKTNNIIHRIIVKWYRMTLFHPTEWNSLHISYPDSSVGTYKRTINNCKWTGTPCGWPKKGVISYRGWVMHHYRTVNSHQRTRLSSKDELSPTKSYVYYRARLCFQRNIKFWRSLKSNENRVMFYKS